VRGFNALQKKPRWLVRGGCIFIATPATTSISTKMTREGVVTGTAAVLRGVTDLEEGQDGFVVLRNDGTIWLWGAPDGNTAYAKNYGITNVLQLGWAGGNPAAVRYVTSDGIYHRAMNNVSVSCGASQ
jgi:hypothetical protein